MNIPKNQRLLALDILRGITIAGMILVNNPGNWIYVYTPLGHAKWNGLTPTDLIFPFFMFIMGISTYISLRKYQFEFSSSAAWKILKRTVVIFAIGLGIAAFALLLRGKGFDEIRIMGVMQRLGLCYGATALIALLVKHKYIPYLIAILLGGYWLALLLGNGFVADDTNIINIVDRAIIGSKHLYHGMDPEGLLSTIPSIAHVLIGFYCGKLMMETKDIQEKMLRLLLIGASLTFVGFLLSYGCPLNKRVWSPTFALVTCGMASSFLALLIWIIDVKGYKRWTRFFEVFGINPLFLYVLAAVLSLLLDFTGITYAGELVSLKGYLYSAVLQPLLGNYPASTAFALLFVAVNWLIGYPLYKKKIYIKI